MDKTINISAEVIRQLGYIAERNAALEEENSEKAKEEILASLDRSLKELRQNQEGTLAFQSWEDFRDELREEGYLH